MPRLVGFTPGTGDNASFDGNVQRVKMVSGDDGITNDVGESNPLATKPTADDILAINLKMVQLLAAISSKLPAKNYLQQMRVAIEASAALTLSANQSVNMAQANGIAVLMGTGASGTGSLRVTPANDTTAGIPHIYAAIASLTATRVASTRALIST